MAQSLITAGDGSQWIVTPTQPRYGRPVAATRAYWFHRAAGSESPVGSALHGIAGFYSRWPDGKRV